MDGWILKFHNNGIFRNADIDFLSAKIDGNIFHHSAPRSKSRNAATEYKPELTFNIIRTDPYLQ